MRSKCHLDFCSSLLLAYSLTIIIASIIPSNEAAPPGSLVTKLPGFSGTLPSQHHGGYVSFNDKNLYYYFVSSERNPSEDPVMLWLNGGPGCSSFDGFVYEHGPFNYEKGTSNGSLPILHLNPYSWSKVSNMIYLDSPCGVGLSYSNNQSNYVNDDFKTAIDSHTFLLKWFELYPEFAKNPFYISGESYAGVYVPMLSSEVVKGIQAGVQPVINFKGYLVGNGVTDDTYESFESYLQFVHGMGLISNDINEEVEANCKNWTNPTDACLKSYNKVGNISVTGPWEICTDKIEYGYGSGSMMPYHRNLTMQGYPALIYSGDHDKCVPFTGTQAWTRGMGYSVTDEWRSWISNEQVAGYLQGYAHNLTFLTIKGAGHTVPEYKPRESANPFDIISYHIISYIINGPTYNSNSLINRLIKYSEVQHCFCCSFDLTLALF